MAKYMVLISCLIIGSTAFSYEGGFRQDSKTPKNAVSAFDGGQIYVERQGDSTLIYDSQGKMIANVETQSIPSLKEILAVLDKSLKSHAKKRFEDTKGQKNFK